MPWMLAAAALPLVGGIASQLISGHQQKKNNEAMAKMSMQQQQEFQKMMAPYLQSSTQELALSQQAALGTAGGGPMAMGGGAPGAFPGFMPGYGMG